MFPYLCWIFVLTCDFSPCHSIWHDLAGPCKRWPGWCCGARSATGSAPGRRSRIRCSAESFESTHHRCCLDWNQQLDPTDVHYTPAKYRKTHIFLQKKTWPAISCYFSWEVFYDLGYPQIIHFYKWFSHDKASSYCLQDEAWHRRFAVLRMAAIELCLNMLWWGGHYRH